MPKPLLLSLHRSIALHQRAAIARAYAEDGGASPDSIDIRHETREFDPAHPDRTAAEILRELDADVPDWRQQPLYYIPPGLPSASDAWRDALLARQADARIVRLGVYGNQYGEANPALWVVKALQPVRGGDATEVYPAWYEEERPKQIVLIDLAERPLDKTRADTIWEEGQLPRWYPDGVRLLHLGGRDCPDLCAGGYPEDYMRELHTWIVSHRATHELDWANEPVVLSWFRSGQPRLLSALVCLHGLTGGFPTTVVYARKPDAREDAESYDDWTSRLANLRQRRLDFRGTNRHPTAGVALAREEPRQRSPIATAWIIKNLARYYVHVREDSAKLRCAQALTAPIAQDGRPLERFLEPEVWRYHLRLASAADAALDTGLPAEWRPAITAAWAHAHRLGTELASGEGCVTLKALLVELQKAVCTNDGVNGLRVQVDTRSAVADERWCIDHKCLATAARNLAVTVCRDLRGNPIGWPGNILTLSCVHHVRGDKRLLLLGLAHNGCAPTDEARSRIQSSPGCGTLALMDFARAHAATLRLFWRDGNGDRATTFLGFNQGRYKPDPMQGFALVTEEEPQKGWISSQDRDLGTRPVGPIPDGHTTLWEYELDAGLLLIEKTDPRQW